MLYSRAVDSPRLSQVDEDEVVVGAAGHDHVSQLLHLFAKRLAVAQYLQRESVRSIIQANDVKMRKTNLELVLLKLWGLSLL